MLSEGTTLEQRAAGRCVAQPGRGKAGVADRARGAAVDSLRRFVRGGTQVSRGMDGVLVILNHGS